MSRYSGPGFSVFQLSARVHEILLRLSQETGKFQSTIIEEALELLDAEIGRKAEREIREAPRNTRTGEKDL